MGEPSRDGAPPRAADAGAWRIAWRTFRSAPPRARRIPALAVAYMVAVVALAAEHEGFASMARPASLAGLLGGVSGLVLGLSHGLFHFAQEGRWSTRWRWRLEPKRLDQMILALPVLGFTAGALSAASIALMLPLLSRSVFYWLGFAPMLFVVFGAAAAVGESVRFLYRYAREQSEAAAKARAEAADAQLAALQAQLEPHFLFNALNTIASLVRTDARRAEAATENLARMLRRTLDRSRRTSTTVEEELDYVRAYLGIEQERFGGRLTAAWDIEPDARPLRIPPMTLQPLVENALKHGIGGRIGGGRIEIGVRRDGDRLVLRVADDGIGFPRRWREGTGLGNLRRRLETLYGDAAELRIETPAAGADVVLVLPAEGV